MRKFIQSCLLVSLTSVLLSACSEDNQKSDTQEDIAVVNKVVEDVEKTAMVSGEEIFNMHCLSCHAAGPGHPGTMRLELRLGKDKSVLTERDDLHPEYIKTIVRQGILLMPPFRPSEITDSELLALATYLAPVKN